MKTISRLFIVLVLLSSTLGLFASPALAAPPANDLFANAMIVTTNFTGSQDTTEATTDADDAQLNSSCGAPATDASVWYALTVPNDAIMVVDVSSSNYSAGLLVGIGAQGSLQVVACGPGTISFFAAAGETYYVLAIDDQLNGDGLNGGLLNISFAPAFSPTMQISVNPVGIFNSKTGSATISGKYTCENGNFVDLSVNARQLVGRFYIQGSGYFFTNGTCDGASHSWSAVVTPENGLFKGGKTISVALAYTCGSLECAYGYAEKTVFLRGK